MSYEARFSADPMPDARRGYDELAKGVFQIWRFASHRRRGVLSQKRVQDGVKGIVLTLDNWLSIANAMQSDVVEHARVMAGSRDPDLLKVDQIPIIFCAINDLEQTLSMATEKLFFAAVAAAAAEGYQGWHLSGVHSHIAPEVNKNNGYPVENRMTDVLPSWDKFGQSPAAPT